MTTQEMRELDAWIAENVFGWSGRVEVAKGRSLKSCGEFYTAFKTFPYAIGDYSQHVTRDGTKVYCGEPFQFRRPPNYTTDPAEAMDVLKKCAEKESNGVVCGKLDGKWCVTRNGNGGGFFEVSTTELAICLFAKKLFSKDTNEK